MSLKHENEEILEEAVVNEEETTELVELEREAKKAKIINIAKKVGKVAGYVIVAGLGFIIGNAVGSKSENDDSEIIDVDYEVETDA